MSSAQSIAVTYNQQSSGYLRTDLQAVNRALHKYNAHQNRIDFSPLLVCQH